MKQMPFMIRINKASQLTCHSCNYNSTSMSNPHTLYSEPNSAFSEPTELCSCNPFIFSTQQRDRRPYQYVNKSVFKLNNQYKLLLVSPYLKEADNFDTKCNF